MSASISARSPRVPYRPSPSSWPPRNAHSAGQQICLASLASMSGSVYSSSGVSHMSFSSLRAPPLGTLRSARHEAARHGQCLDASFAQIRGVHLDLVRSAECVSRHPRSVRPEIRCPPADPARRPRVPLPHEGKVSVPVIVVRAVQSHVTRRVHTVVGEAHRWSPFIPAPSFWVLSVAHGQARAPRAATSYRPRTARTAVAFAVLEGTPPGGV